MLFEGVQQTKLEYLIAIQKEKLRRKGDEKEWIKINYITIKQNIRFSLSTYVNRCIKFQKMILFEKKLDKQFVVLYYMERT